MRCGTKRYIVKALVKNREVEVRIPARTPAEARKIFRTKYGTEIDILSVREM